MACVSEAAPDSDSQAGELMSVACGLIDLGSQRLGRLGATLTHEVTKDK